MVDWDSEFSMHEEEGVGTKEDSFASGALIDIDKAPVFSQSMLNGKQPTQTSAEFEDYLLPSELDSIIMMPNQFHNIGDSATGFRMTGTTEVADNSGPGESPAIAGASTRNLGSPTLVLVDMKPQTENLGTEQVGKRAAGGTELDRVIGERLLNMKEEPLDIDLPEPQPSNDQMEEDEAEEEEEAPRRRQPKKKWCPPADVNLVDLDALDNCVLRVRPKRAKLERKRVPEEDKDAEYFAKRKKNTLAARRCRQKKRDIDEVRVNLIKRLHAEVTELRETSAEVKKAEEELQQAEEDLLHWKDLAEKILFVGRRRSSRGNK